MALSVLIVEDDPGTREALELGLQAIGLEVCGAYGTGREAIAASARCAPDVALVDLGLPDCSGLDVIRALKQQAPRISALVLTVFESPREVTDAIEAGARGYLLKGTPLADIARALQEVRDGLSPISPAVARHLLDRIAGRQESACVELTERELEVLELLVRGHSYASTGLALDITVGTVQSHVKNIYRKLEVSSKAEATAVAIRQGLLPD